MPKDLSRPWEDPLAEAGERQLAQGMRGTNLSAPEIPEWKQKAMGKAPTLGVKDVRPIKDQRESLPIFLLRDELIQAVHANQVLVVIGETGELASISLHHPKVTEQVTHKLPLYYSAFLCFALLKQASRSSM